ncbi:MAG: serine/threonine-protein kinase [Gallionella sp.]|nr:serine/threonine-protein kinase [Gallionella sp.]
MDASYIDLSIIATTHQYAVFEIARVKDQHPFAKKQLKPESEALGADRFRNEVRLLARLDHPNIIRVIDQQLSDFPLYVVTPLYKGNLREWIRSATKGVVLAGDDIQDIFDRLLDAVAYAHDQGIIHRDLKPENVLLNSPRDVVLIDFNISVLPDDTIPRLTRPGEVLGTPHYLAPEQLRGMVEIDHRVDIFSLGIILYEMHGGKIGSSILDLSYLPAAIRGIVQRCIQADRAKRYSTVSDLKRAWHLALDLNTKQSEVNELEGFMLSGYKFNSGQIERILDLLDEYSDDPDRVDRFFMEADPEAISVLAVENLGRLEPLLSNWIGFISQKSWPFSHTDAIARRVEALWPAIESPLIRAELVVALIVLGNNHNRFFVWRSAATLIERCVHREDVDALIQQLTIMDRHDLTTVSGYLVRSRLNPVLAQLFVKDRADSVLQ